MKCTLSVVVAAVVLALLVPASTASGDGAAGGSKASKWKAKLEKKKKEAGGDGGGDSAVAAAGAGDAGDAGEDEDWAATMLKSGVGAGGDDDEPGAENGFNTGLKPQTDAFRENGVLHVTADDWRIKPENLALAKEASLKFAKSAVAAYATAQAADNAAAAAAGGAADPQDELGLSFKEWVFRANGCVGAVVPELLGWKFAFLRNGPWMDVARIILGEEFDFGTITVNYLFPPGYKGDWGPEEWRDEMGRRYWARTTAIHEYFASLGDSAADQERSSKTFGVVLFIPLVDITASLSAIPTSHEDTVNDLYENRGRSEQVFVAKAGEPILLDTRVFLRWLSNNSTEPQPFVQMHFASSEGLQHNMFRLQPDDFGEKSLFAADPTGSPGHEEL